MLRLNPEAASSAFKDHPSLKIFIDRTSLASSRASPHLDGDLNQSGIHLVNKTWHLGLGVVSWQVAGTGVGQTGQEGFEVGWVFVCSSVLVLTL